MAAWLADSLPATVQKNLQRDMAELEGKSSLQPSCRGRQSSGIFMQQRTPFSSKWS
jgi:hypothetical protein